MRKIEWNLRGFATVEGIMNNSRVSKYARKMAPSELFERVNMLHLDFNDQNGCRVLEGTCNDPLFLAIQFGKMKLSKCEGNSQIKRKIMYFLNNQK